jgi:hypothetical protein
VHLCRRGLLHLTRSPVDAVAAGARRPAYDDPHKDREKVSTVESFSILYKASTDPDGWESRLAPILRDRGEALNKTIATDKTLSQFTSDNTIVRLLDS